MGNKSLSHTSYNCKYHIVLPIVISITQVSMSIPKAKIMIHLTLDYKSDQDCRTPGEYLRYHRTFQGKSTREVAESVGIVPATLVPYENDKLYHICEFAERMEACGAVNQIFQHKRYVDNLYRFLHTESGMIQKNSL